MLCGTVDVVLLWFALLCLVAAAVCALPLGETGRRPFLGGFCVLLAVVSTGWWYRTASLEWELSRVASEVYGVGVEVRCRSYVSTHFFNRGQPGWVAFEHEVDDDGNAVLVTSGVAELGEQVCGALRRFRSDPSTTGRDERVAVHVLSHEAAHVYGIVDEGETECFAMERTGAIAEGLGASPEAAAELVEFYRTQIYPRMPREYRTGNCG